MSKSDLASKNILINAGFPFFNRTLASVTLTTTPSYINADRFRLSYSGTVTGTPSSIQSTDVPNNKTRNSLKFTTRRNASAVSVVAAQRVESLNASESVGEVVSKSGWCKSSTATSVTLTIRVPTAQDNYTSSSIAHTQTVSITANNTWQLFKFEAITLPDVSNGFEVEIALNSPNGTDASPVEHLISQLKLNHGYKATGFSRAGRTISDELILCQRYYEVLNAAVYGTWSANVMARAMWSFKVTKRTVPVITLVSSNGSVQDTGTDSVMVQVSNSTVTIGIGSSANSEI